MNIQVLNEYIHLMGNRSTWKGLKEYAQLIKDIGGCDAIFSRR